VEWRPDDYGRPSHAAAIAKADAINSGNSDRVTSKVQSACGRKHGKMVPNAAATVQVAMLDAAAYATVLRCRSHPGNMEGALKLLAPLKVYVIEMMKGQVSSVVLVALLSALMRR